MLDISLNDFYLGMLNSNNIKLVKENIDLLQETFSKIHANPTDTESTKLLAEFDDKLDLIK